MNESISDSTRDEEEVKSDVQVHYCGNDCEGAKALKRSKGDGAVHGSILVVSGREHNPALSRQRKERTKWS